MGLYKRGIEKSNDTAPKKVSVRERSQVLQKIAEPLQKKESPQKISSLKTDIDKFYHILEISGSSVPQAKVLEILDVSSMQLEDWAKVLERQNLIEIVYTATGGVLYQLKGVPVKKIQASSPTKTVSGFSSLDDVHRKKIYLRLGLLLLVGAILLLGYLYWGNLSSYISSLHDTFTDATGWGL